MGSFDAACATACTAFAGAAPSTNQQLVTFVLVLLACAAIGVLGSLAGLGGGVLVVPLLTLAFGLPFREAAGASVVSVIATSSGAAAAYVREHLTNLRIGMFLEVATTLGAVTGALVAALLPSPLLFLIFGGVLLVSAVPMVRQHDRDATHAAPIDPLARTFALSGSYPDRQTGRTVSYVARRVPLGFSLMYLAGTISGLLGIGSGPFKVLALDTAMQLPLKVSTTTSNFMIGVTAAASAGLYFARGDIHPLVAAPVALGVVSGALVGAKLLPRISNKTLRILFVVLLVVSAAEMLAHGISAL